MAFCANCGTKMDDGVKFCPSCGTPAGGAAPAAPKPAAEKVGNIRKCPACGAVVPSMTTKCPECGHEFSNVKVTGSIQTFFDKLDNLDDADLADAKKLLSARSIKQAGSTVLWSYVLIILIGLAILPLTFGLLSESMVGKIAGVAGTVILEFLVSLIWRAKSPKWTLFDIRKQTYIEAFPIPNAKEDIFEFLMLASNMVKKGGSKWTGRGKIILKWNDIWQTKCKQVYNKAMISMSSDPQALETVQNLIKQVGIKKDIKE
jgi:RNA polymerase subunit RPABC4/transcription elongation factor Spt4